MKPTVFIGSSTEGLSVAYTVQEALQYSVEPTVWTQGIFDLSKSVLFSLFEALNKYEFAIFVITPDDVTKLRDREMQTPRDNVIFELGLFMGKLGQDKTFFIIPRNCDDLHLPSDLLGIEPAIYDANRSDGNLAAALGPACFRISQLISEKYAFAYGDECVSMFRALGERIKRILLQLINRTEKPDNFPLPQSLEDEGVGALWQISKLLNIQASENMTMLCYQTVKLRIMEKGDMASAIQTLEMEQELKELEEKVSEWEQRVF